MAKTHVSEQVERKRDALRLAGLLPVQMGVLNPRRPDFAAECRRQCLLIAQRDASETGLQHLIDAVLDDIHGWHMEP